jgi:NitT/TauT family transport system substrate-binding protein
MIKDIAFTRRQALVGALAAGLATTSVARAQALVPVNFGVTGLDPLYSHVFLAHKLGLFKQEGIESNVINAQSGSRVSQMVAASQVDFAMSGLFDPLRLTIAGKQSKIIAAFDQRIAYSNAFIHKDDAEKYKTIKDLAGQSIAVTQPQTPMWLMAVYLAERGGVKDQISFRAAGDFISLLAMVKTKQVACGFATISMMDAAVSEGWGMPLIDVAEESAWKEAFGGPIPGTGCWALSDTIEGKPDLTQKVSRALRQAQAISIEWTSEKIVETLKDDYFRSLSYDVAKRNVEKYQAGIWAKNNLVNRDDYGRIVNLLGDGRMYSNDELASKVPYDKMVDMTYAEASLK